MSGPGVSQPGHQRTDVDNGPVTLPSRPVVRVPATYIWAAVVLVVAVIGGVVALYALAPANRRPVIAGLFIGLVTGVPTLLAALGAWIKSRSAVNIAADHGATLDHVANQLNGGLDERIQTNVRAVVAENPQLVSSEAVQATLHQLLTSRLEAGATAASSSASTDDPAAWSPRTITAPQPNGAPA